MEASRRNKPSIGIKALPRHQYLFLFLFYRIVMSWLSYSVSVWSLGQHVCRFSAAIAHLSSFWCFGNLQNHPVSLTIYASLLIANSKSVLNIKSRRRPTYLKRRPYKVILGGNRAKHSASSVKVFICNFCLSSNASLSWLGTSIFPRVRHLWIRCIHRWICPEKAKNRRILLNSIISRDEKWHRVGMNHCRRS